ncbi:AbrB/MazE/SpoVT family DNA-binding domain-containing protein [Thalassobacillus hwangdonensis]|uniref:AbrB/MazE/SpoVT family DNA-binding domain-containing protein n=1 Tax=Thalassobacillus hwangdonensis TaxID=546108 RepID=A0ABW3L691_9BACI
MGKEVYRCKQLPKTGMVYIPIKWCREFGLESGDQVDIYHDGTDIFIEKASEASLHNKRYISAANSVNIPVEIRNYAGITSKQDYCLYVDETNERFIISLVE